MNASDILTPLGKWQDSDTSISAVISALQQLRNRARAASRVSVVNLVVVVADSEAADRATKVLEEMGARHPARSVIFVLEPDARSSAPRIDVSATLYGSFISGHPVCSDVVQVAAYGPVIDHLSSLLEPLRLVDVPIAVWYFETEPSIDDSLLKLADAVIVDTKELGAAFALQAISEVDESHPVVDLSWLRLIPWRELLANLFQGEMLRPYLDNVISAEVFGKAAPRRLLSGWLAGQLNLDQSQIRLEDAQHVTIRLVGEFDGKRGEFVVEREEDRRVVRACVTIDGEEFYSEFAGLHDHPLSYSLTQALIHLNRNVVFDRALKCGLALENAA